jgi:lauroyl/myristoyl acyltransferase
MDLESLRFLYLRRIVTPILSAMPFRMVQSLAQVAGRGVHSMNTPGRHRAESRLARFADSLSASPSEIVEAMYEHTARFWAEALFARRRLSEARWRNHIRVVDEERLAQLGGSKPHNGCLLTTACLGSPVACAMALGHLFKPVHVIVDFATHPMLGAWQREMFSIRNVSLIDRRSAAAQIPNILGNGGGVLMLCDSPRIHGRCVPISFLGQPFRAHPTLGRLAKWFDVPIGVVSCMRAEKACSFELHLHDTIRPDASDNPDDLTRRAMRSIEQAILKTPEQYLWSLPGGNDSSENGMTAEPRYAYGNLIGVVPQITSKSVGLANAVNGGQYAGKLG